MAGSYVYRGAIKNSSVCRVLLYHTNRHRYVNREIDEDAVRILGQQVSIRFAGNLNALTMN